MRRGERWPTNVEGPRCTVVQRDESSTLGKQSGPLRAAFEALHCSVSSKTFTLVERLEEHAWITLSMHGQQLTPCMSIVSVYLSWAMASVSVDFVSFNESRNR